MVTHVKECWSVIGPMHVTKEICVLWSITSNQYFQFISANTEWWKSKTLDVFCEGSWYWVKCLIYNLANIIGWLHTCTSTTDWNNRVICILLSEWTVFISSKFDFVTKLKKQEQIMPVKNNNDNALSTALQVHGYHTKITQYTSLAIRLVPIQY